LSQTDYNTQQLAVLENINLALQLEYESRRAVLLKRLDVTVGSFLWGDKAKGHEEDISASIHSLQEALGVRSAFSVYHVFVARDDLLILNKASSKDPKKSVSVLKTLLIGKVPDRGGRVIGDQTRPSNMPQLVKRGSGVQQPQREKGNARVQGGWGGGGRGRGRGRGRQENLKQRK